MSIFDFFRSPKKQAEPAAKVSVKTVPAESMPTVKPDEQMYVCYDEVFWKMIRDVSGITPVEASDIHRTITMSDGGFMNQNGYYALVWEKYFKGRNWRWEEYELWNAIFTKLGRYPSRFPVRINAAAASLDDAISKLTVAELKSLCAEHNVEIPARAKKNDLSALLVVVPRIESSVLVAAKMDEINDRFAYALYTLLFRTIQFRGMSQHDRKRFASIGVMKYEVDHVFEEDKEFVEMALKKNPDALHPLFPSDMSSRKIVVEFFDE